MDAVKFLKEYKRLCEAHGTCKECLLRGISDSCSMCCNFNRYSDDELNKIVWIVENWSEENPEELEKKYIIEIDKVDGDTCRVKGAKWWAYRADLEKLEEYKGE